MASRAQTADPAGENVLAKQAGENWQFHEVGSTFRHFHADLKLHNVEPDAFSKASAEERVEIENQMNALLDRTRTRGEMFPDSKLTYSLGRMYFQVFSDETSLNFPRADNDLRALYQRFAYLFRTSYLHKIVLKRGIILGAIVLYCGLVAGAGAFCETSDALAPYRGSAWTCILTFLVSALPVYVLYRLVLGWADQQFTTALQQSCIAVSQNTLQRLAALKACIDNIQIAIRDSYDLDENKWMAQSDYLMALTIWLPLRVLHIERYFQMTMWRVHRSFVYIQYAAVVLQAALFALVLGAAWGIGPQAFAGGMVGAYSFTAVMLCFAYDSFVGASTSVRFIRDNIPIDQWKTFGELRMDTVVSGVVGFLIKKFIMLRDVGRPNH